jgi:hypothetical protein
MESSEQDPEQRDTVQNEIGDKAPNTAPVRDNVMVLMYRCDIRTIEHPTHNTKKGNKNRYPHTRDICPESRALR